MKTNFEGENPNYIYLGKDVGEEKPDLTIVIPTYNEADNIYFLLNALKESLKGIKYEILVVDDNSPDGTWQIAHRIGGVSTRVIVRIGVRGLASAIIDGFKASKGKYVIVMDADLQHPPKYVSEMLNIAEKYDADIVVASRYIKGGGVEGWSPLRLLISKTATLLAKLLLPETRVTTDPVSGFFLIKRSLLKGCVNYLKPRGYKILPEILVKCRPDRIVDMPYIFKQRLYDESKLGFKTLLNYVLHILELSKWRPIKFLIVGTLGYLINIATIWLLISLNDKIDFWLATIAGIESSSICNFIFHDLWTFRDRRFYTWWKRLMKFHLAVFPAVFTQYIASNTMFYIFWVPWKMAVFIGVVLGFIINYILSELNVWSGH